MRRTQESGAYIGGIGAMLEAADACPSCGQVHAEQQYGIRHGSARTCPSVVVGSFPVITTPESTVVPEAIPSPVPLTVPAAGRPARVTPSWDVPVSLGSLPAPPREYESRSRNLAGLWLPPPDLGEVL